MFADCPTNISCLVRRAIEPRHRCFYPSSFRFRWIPKSLEGPCRNDAQSRVAVGVIHSSVREAVCWPICDSQIRCWCCLCCWPSQGQREVDVQVQPPVLPAAAMLPSGDFRHLLDLLDLSMWMICNKKGS